MDSELRERAERWLWGPGGDIAEFCSEGHDVIEALLKEIDRLERELKATAANTAPPCLLESTRFEAWFCRNVSKQIRETHPEDEDVARQWEHRADLYEGLLELVTPRNTTERKE